MLSSEPFPLYQELEPSSMPMTIQNLFYFPLLFSVNDNGQWQWLRLSFKDQVFWSSRQLYYVKHRMEFFYYI